VPANRLAIAGLLTACATGTALAGEWSLGTSLHWSADHDTNRMLNSAALESGSMVADIDLQLMRRGERGDFRLTPRLRLQRFTRDVADDVNDVGVSLGAGYQMERARYDFGAEYSDESTLNGEVLDTGVIAPDARRRLASANLVNAWQQTENSSLSTTLATTDVSYTGSGSLHLYDYRYHSLALRQSFAMNERFAWFVGALGNLLESPERGSDSREVGSSLGVNVAMSARTTLSLSVGRSWRSFMGVQTRGDTREFSLVHREELRDWTFGYSLSLVPYAAGVLGEREQLSFRLRQPLTEHVDVALDCLRVRNNEALPGLTTDRRDYRRAEASVGWRLSPSVTVRSALRYTQASLVDSWGDTDGWNVGLSASWDPQPRVFGH
jgi:hypothetical protein